MCCKLPYTKQDSPCSPSAPAHRHRLLKEQLIPVSCNGTDKHSDAQQDSSSARKPLLSWQQGGCSQPFCSMTGKPVNHDLSTPQPMPRPTDTAWVICLWVLPAAVSEAGSHLSAWITVSPCRFGPKVSSRHCPAHECHGTTEHRNSQPISACVCTHIPLHTASLAQPFTSYSAPASCCSTACQVALAFLLKLCTYQALTVGTLAPRLDPEAQPCLDSAQLSMAHAHLPSVYS